MSLPLLDPVEVTTVSDDDDLNHYFCCNENVGLCGKDLSDSPLAEDLDDDDPNLCIVCYYTNVCSLCGYVFT